MKMEITDYEVFIMALNMMISRQESIKLLEEEVIPMLDEQMDEELGEKALIFARMKEMVKITLHRFYNLEDQQCIELGGKTYDNIVHEIQKREPFFSHWASSEDDFMSL